MDIRDCHSDSMRIMFCDRKHSHSKIIIFSLSKALRQIHKINVGFDERVVN